MLTSFKIFCFQFWNPRLECPTLTGYASRFKNITWSYIEQNLNYDLARQQWGVAIDTGGVSVFHECYIDPAMPTGLSDVVRTCSGKSTIINCPENYSDQTVKELCHSYTALIFEPNTAYRNVHCAICNNADLDKLICLNLGPFGRFNWQQNFNSFSFAVLFDLGGNSNASVGHEVACNDGELYDPFFSKCRSVSCGSKGKIYRKGKCFDVSIVQEVTTDATISSTAATSTTTSESISSTTTTIATTTLSETFETTTTTLTPLSTETQFVEEITLITTEIEAVFENITQTSTTPVTNTTDEITESYNELVISSSEKPSTTSESTVEPKPDPKSPKDNFVDCPKFELQVGEFKMMNESVVYIEKYDTTLDSDQFDLDNSNNVLIICASLAGGTEEVGKFSKYMSYVTLVCLGISIICLLLHLTATFVSPDLQNLSGKNLFSLSLALLGSYVTFIFAMFRSREEDLLVEDSGCFALAVVMYFFFMASFFWMLVIAFDVCRTLRVIT